MAAAVVVGLGALSVYTISKAVAMSSKLIPPSPSEVMVIRDISPNIVTLSVPFSRFGRIHIGGRGTIVRMSSGGLAVFSPVALTPEVREKVKQMGGSVQYLVAPDIEHHIFLSDWAKEYPEARLIGPEGLPEKRAKASASDPKIGKEPFFAVFEARSKLGMTVAPDFDADFAYEYVDAHPNKELVFFYRPERVLIEADLLFNLPAIEQYSRVPEKQRQAGALDRLFLRLNSPAGDAKALKRVLWYGASRADRPGFNASITRIDAWDFVTVIPCHGEVLIGNGKDVFRKVFQWHLQGHK